MSVFAYVRASTGDDPCSVDIQRREIAAVAELSGLSVDDFTIEEPGISGSMPFADRPEGGVLPICLVTGDVLIVASLDRAFCNAADALATAERLKACQVDLIVADMGSESVTQSWISRMFFGMLTLVAAFERDRIKERSAEGGAAKRRDGGHIGGSPPFGYRKIGVGRAARLEPEPAQQAALAEMRRLAAKGLASRAIAAAVRERHGIAVSHVTVRAALARQGGSAVREVAAASDQKTGWSTMINAFGSSDRDFAEGLVMQLANAGTQGKIFDGNGPNFMLAVIQGIGPKDEIEAMLAAQMAAVHMATMTFARKLAHTEDLVHQDSAERAFNKLARTFAVQAEALKRYRTGGEQKVTVQHVTVNEGGRAIVGPVSAASGGVGHAEKG